MVKIMKRNRLSLNDVEWGEFRVKELFDKIVKGKISNQNLQTLHDSKGISYLSATKINNGVSGFVKRNNLFQKGNCIMFINQGDGGAGYCIYKSEDFMSTSSNSFGYANWINKYTGLFFSTISSQLKEKYSFGYGRTDNRLKRDKIMLPKNIEGNPNWQFMEDYIKQEQKDIAQKVISYYEQKILETSFDLLGFENVLWKEFHFSEIFRKIQRGKRLKKDDHIEGDVPYISSTSLNNGLDQFIGNEDRVRKFKNNLTLANSGSVGSCFYHEYEYIASDHVTSLTLDRADKYVYLFMSTIIKRLEEKYSFNREINDKRIRNERFILPVDKNGNPHWDYMSEFMKKLEVKNLEKVLEYIYIYI